MKSKKPVKEKNHKSRVAWVLRQKIKMGQILTDDEKAWLMDFKLNKSASPPQISIDIPVEEKVESNDSQENGPPPLIVSSSVAEERKSEDSETGPSASTEEEPAFEKSGFENTEDASPSDTSDEQTTKQGIDLAEKYCKLLRDMSNECTALGGIGIPDFIVDGPIKFAAENTFKRMAMTFGEVLSERGQDAVVVASGGILFIQRHFLRRKRQPMSNGNPSPSKEQKQSAKLVSMRGTLPNSNEG